MFKTFKDNIMGLYKKVKGEKEPDKEESFIPIECEQVSVGLIGVIQLMEEVEWM